METIRIYRADEQEYQNLAYVAKIMTARSLNRTTFEVGVTYFDFGQNWKWTTILAYKENGDSFQALSPDEQKKIVLANVEDLETVAQELMENCEKEYPRLYSFRKGKKIWKVTYARTEYTTFTVEADDYDEAYEMAESYADENWEELDEELDGGNYTYEFSDIKEEK